ncbi:hypothetical protein IW139_006803 [Coemansia sp. RSA 353]|nr:hypothetical protein LPJ62_003308 [Coemansia sp. RSA 2167]KAJ2135819.1 hypothetical protein GGH17_002212 [Coemansia sp. RSA 788]KAJ2148544.1 hypothetical protein J3F82_004678 [Coemansia sp. RSA 637]KAJ2154489.1 hypothetical protein GGH15_005830 [Coemansia sp. RSA 562]KAJ2189063.1 hypothetical protein EV181_001839 [Coemansia sp. RSA 532]KAJ2191804.1 hypothetical protein GGH18_003121 [Coemansia sp. RSA 530]KAJ2202955.1 hypothetical protein IW145_004370 [Coemansia sp. RSA 521]KAJ2222988.1 hy
MYQQGPPRADSGGMPPAGFGAQYPPTGQHPAYASTYQGSNIQAPQVAHQANMANTYPGPRYSPPPQPAMSRPMSQYIADNRPSRMSMSHAPHSERPGDTPKTHYGDLVSEANEGATTACSGDAWGACCKYNALACLLCCNGCLRLCGGGMSLMEVLHLN